MKIRHPAFLISLLLVSACQPTDEAPSVADDPLSTSMAARGVALTGRVECADGEAMKGARVTAIAESRRVTVFSNADGAFALPELTARQLEVRADGMQPQRLDSHADGASIVMEPAIDRAALLPSSHWLSLLPDGPMRREFTLNCGSCHGIAHPTVTSAGEFRDEALWLAAMAMMRAVDVYSVIPPDFDDAQYAAWLAEHLTPAAAATIALPQPPADDLLERLLITEYELPQGDSLPHDLVLGPDGRVWITAFFYDQVWGLDPASGDYRKIDIDDDPRINAQARALEFAEDGRLWVVNGETRSVIRLNIETGEYETFDVRMYAHSLDLDTSGNVWVNDYFAAEERIAKVDARTGDVTIIGVPRSGRPASEGIPLPYGLQVDGNDRLYSTQLAANTLVVHDTRTGEAKLLAMPAENSGPRRPGLAPDGSLWIPEFNTGHITRFSPETEDFDRVYLGMPTIGAYDIEVDQRSGIVWTTGSLDSSLFRYDPSSGRIDRIPLPTEPAYTRHLAIDPQTGDVWSAYSSLPPATPRVVRVQMEVAGGGRD